MWTSWNDCIERPQIWDILHERDRSITSAVWFALHSRGCGADYLCTPAPIHNPDGSESLWCDTRPEMIYSELEPKLGHFPLQHFWGPLADIQSTAWIVASAIHAAEKYRPNFFYIYIPHLDYAAQKAGPEQPRRARPRSPSSTPKSASSSTASRRPTAKRRSGSWPASTRSCRSKTSSIPIACSATRGCSK